MVKLWPAASSEPTFSASTSAHGHARVVRAWSAAAQREGWGAWRVMAARDYKGYKELGHGGYGHKEL